ncbi:GNAT family N-acetyltransferase [Jatrophihabitans fulvus]
MTSTIEAVFPPFALRVSAGPLELRLVRDDDLPALVDLAVEGVHDPAVMPFAVPWTDAPADELPWRAAAYHWQTRAGLGPHAWNLNLVVRHEGEVVGVQGLHARDFALVRTAETGSWLGRRHQGRGIGTAMRRAVCAFAFDHLGAERVTSGAFVDNPVSGAVSRRVGYAPDGAPQARVRRPGERALHQRWLLTPDAFARGDVPVRVEGVAALRRHLGLPAEDG